MSETGRTDSFARLTRDSLIYSLGSVAGKAIGIVMLPILTRVLSVDQFGTLDLLSTLVSVLISALLFGFDTAALRLYFDLPDDHDRRRLLTTWLVMAAVLVLPVSAGLALARDPLSTWLFGTTEYGTAIALVALCTVLGTLQFICLTAARMEKRPYAFAVVVGVHLGVTSAVTIGAFIAGHRTATAVLVAMTVGYVASIVVSPLLMKIFSGQPSRALVRRLLRLGLPLAPGVVATWGAEFANRAILVHRAGIDQVAYFSVAVRFGSLGVLVASSFQLAWLPEAYDRGVEEAARARTAVEARRIVATVCVLTVAIALVSREALIILGGRQYLAALGAVGFAELLGVATILIEVASVRSALDHRFSDLGIATVVATAAGVGLNLLLAHRFGATGAAAAITSGLLLGALVVGLLGRRRIAVPISWWWILGNVVVTVVVVLASCLPTDGASIPVRVALGVVAALLFWAEGTPQEVVRWVAARRRLRAS